MLHNFTNSRIHQWSNVQAWTKDHWALLNTEIGKLAYYVHYVAKIHQWSDVQAWTKDHWAFITDRVSTY